MADNARSGLKETKKNVKHWVAVVLFAAIIVVFALWGVNPNQMGGDAQGGVAATVNDTAISLNEFRSRLEAKEQNNKMRFDQFPEKQRRALQAELRRSALDELIMGEVVYQAAKNRGVMAPDAEVRQYILQIPFLQENGRFLKDRYRMFLQNMNMSTEDYERQVRKQIVGQKLQELFVGSALPTREELKRNRQLADHKVNLRFLEISRDDLAKPAFISDEEIAGFAKTGRDQIEKYYKDNAVEFTKPETIHASHILVRVDEKRPDTEAKKLADEIKKQATPKSFSRLAIKYSDDPGSKAKGGELGDIEHGRLVPEFEKAAFALSAGQISEPVKTQYGYHIIYVDKKAAGGTETLQQAEKGIARKLYLRAKEAEVVAKIKGAIEKGGKKEVESLVGRSGLKWTESGEFDLSAPVVPKLGDSKAVIEALLKRGQGTGLVPSLISMNGGNYAVVDVISWKQSSDKADPLATEGIEQMVAYKKSMDLIEAWSKEIEAKATISRNPAILAQ